MNKDNLKKLIKLLTISFSLLVYFPFTIISAQEITQDSLDDLRLEEIFSNDIQLDGQQIHHYDSFDGENDEAIDSIDVEGVQKYSSSNEKEPTLQTSEFSELDDKSENIVTGIWGTIYWEYDTEIKVITLYGGQAGETTLAPWKVWREVEIINIAEPVILQSNSSLLFVSLNNLVAIENSHNLIFSNVTSMKQMFMMTSSLRELDVNEWDVSNVKNMSYLFWGCSALVTLDLSKWDTSEVLKMDFMFTNCVSLTTVHLADWHTKQVQSFESMFDNSGLTSLDLSNWESPSAISKRNIFRNAGALQTLILSENFLLNNSMGLPLIQEEGFTGRWIRRDSNELLDYDNVFENSSDFMNQYDGSQPGRYVWEPVLSLWGTVHWEFIEDNQTIILYGGDSGDVLSAPWKTYYKVEKIIVSDQVSLHEDSSYLFAHLKNLASINNSNKFDMSQVLHMNSMFEDTPSLKELDVSKWDVSNVTSMERVFFDSRIEYLEVGNWVVSNVKNMRNMFQNAQSLTTLDLSKWDTSQVIDMSGMFNGTYSLKELDLSNWNTSEVTDMVNMFNNCFSLRRIKLGEKSIFSISAVNLPNIKIDDQYTGKWVLEDSLIDGTTVVLFENSIELMSNYDGSYPGNYIWERVAPEPLVANIDQVSDQTRTITGYVTELADEFTVTYQNTEGNKVILRKDDPRIIWGDYQKSNQQVRQFRIDLIGNERLETKTKVTITVSKSSDEVIDNITEEQTVIKGIDYRASNLTLDRFKINELPTKEALDTLILQESRAQAVNVLTEADMTDDFRIVETDLTREVDEDGSYFAVLEVGNKAYQMTIGIDVTSKLEHMRVTIPTKMVFESLYNTAESNRNFESQAYEIHNQSLLAVDTYINQLAIDDPAGIVLLKKGEDPLDYAESESEEENLTLTYDDISTPLLRLNLKTEETQIQLYEAMEEQRLIHLEERSRVPIYLTGDFYGDYPQWVVDSEADQGGYYEDLLVPKYRIILRFIP